jgi:hypothetical protein
VYNKNSNYKPVKAVVTPTYTKGENKCFRCNEKWFPGHKFQCKMNKQIRAVNTQEEEENGENNSKEESSETEQEQEEEAEKQNCETAQLSMNAVQGTSSKVNTFVLQVYIGKLKATALVDTGSTRTFIDSKFAICNDLPLSSASKLVVLAANGQEMLSTSQCKGCSYNIQGKDFTIDF